LREGFLVPLRTSCTVRDPGEGAVIASEQRARIEIDLCITFFVKGYAGGDVDGLLRLRMSLDFAARYPAYPLISSKDEFASLESILLEAFQSGGQYYPGFVSGARPPQLALRQLGKLPGQTFDVFRSGI
jgi:hypothetical protein